MKNKKKNIFLYAKEIAKIEIVDNNVDNNNSKP